MKKHEKLENKEIQDIIVQHNDFVNAKFDLSTNEMRLFIAMLSRLKRIDEDFATYSIPVNEFCKYEGGSTYHTVREVCKSMLYKVIMIEAPATKRGKVKKEREFIGMPLMAICRYVDGNGYVEVEFNEKVKPFLLQLTANFTKAQIEQLLKLKSFHAYRIYWLLKQRESFGERTIGIDELKEMLNMENLYEDYYDFKRRILLPAQKELAETDIPFEFEPIKAGRAVQKIRFVIQKTSKSLAAAKEPEKWKTDLLALGIADYSIEGIEVLINQGTFTGDYVLYVIEVMRKKQAEGKIATSIAGAIYTAIVNSHLLAEFSSYQETKVFRKPPKKAKISPEAIVLRLDEQEDGFNKMKAQGASKYPDFESYVEGLIQQGFQLEQREGGNVLVKYPD